MLNTNIYIQTSWVKNIQIFSFNIKVNYVQLQEINSLVCMTDAKWKDGNTVYN